MPRTNNPQSATSALAKRLEQEEGRQASVARYLHDLQPEIARALPRGMNADRVTRLALTTVRKSVVEAAKRGDVTKSLAYCSPESFAGSLLTAAALGLEPDVNAEAYLVPYRGECTLIVGYQGLVKLFYQHPLAKHLECDTVRERDQFDYAKGTAPFLTHKPALGDRGEIIAYYGAATLTTGAVSFVVLTPEEVKALRRGKEGPSGDIPDPMRWMEKKTAIRQLFKLLPKSTTLQVALAVDERPGTELYRDRLDDADPNRQGRLEGPHPEPGVEHRIVNPDDGPAYDARTGEVQDDAGESFAVQDPPEYDLSQEPPTWRDQGGAS
jgi:recombination protein RecT